MTLQINKLIILDTNRNELGCLEIEEEVWEFYPADGVKVTEKEAAIVAKYLRKLNSIGLAVGGCQ